MEKYIAPESGWVAGRRVEAGEEIELHPSAAKYEALPRAAEAAADGEADAKKARK